jgi:hypothetical protein
LAIVHNTKELGCGRLLERFPNIVTRLQQILERFLGNLYCMDAAFVSDNTLDELSQPSQVGSTPVGGMDVNQPRMRAVLSAALALALFTRRIYHGRIRRCHTINAQSSGCRLQTPASSVRPQETAGPKPREPGRKIPPLSCSAIRHSHHGSMLLLREKVLRPILSAVRHQNPTAKPVNHAEIDQHYQALRQAMQTLLNDLCIAAENRQKFVDVVFPSA